MEKDSETSNTRDFVTTSEAAEALGVLYYTVYEYIKEKRLVAEMIGGIYMIPKKAVQEFKAKPTGRVRTRPPHWRKYRAGAKVRGMDIRVLVRAGQEKRLIDKLEKILEAQRYLFPGTMQRYVFEEEADPKYLVFSLIWKDTEMPDESVIQQDLKPLQAEFADVLDWDTAHSFSKQATMHTGVLFRRYLTHSPGLGTLPTQRAKRGQSRAMRTQAEDTSPEMERVHIALIRKASPAKLFGLVRSMSQTMIQASMRNIRKLHPDASQEEITLIFVELYYGKKVANLVRSQIEKRRSG